MGSRVLVMFIIGLTLLGSRNLALDNAVAEKTPNEVATSLTMKENQQLCKLCEQFATEALFYLNENETQIEIIDTLHQVCLKFYSFKLECTKLVDYYAPLFFTKIASLSPEEFCVSVSLCEEVTFIRLPRHEDACTLCHEVVDEVLTDLEDPDMETPSYADPKTVFAKFVASSLEPLQNLQTPLLAFTMLLSTSWH